MIKIYISGAISSLKDEKSALIRKDIKSHIENGNTFNRYKEKVFVFNPYDYFNYFKETQNTEKEVLMYELNELKHSNLVIVDFKDIYSLGTMAEIAIAYDNQIPIIGFNPYNNNLHPWQAEMCNRVFDDFDKLIDYIKNYYLI